MLQVTVKRVGASVVGASGILSLGGAVGGCAADTTAPEALGTGSSAVIVAGSADLELNYAYQVEGSSNLEFLVRSPDGTDEYVRVGEKLRLRIAQYYLWRLAYPNDYWGTDERLDKLSVEAKVQAVRRGAPVGAAITVKTTGTQISPTMGTKEALLAPFEVPQGSDAIRLTLVITDADKAATRVEVGFPTLPPVAVFGGDGAHKTVLFDSTGWNPGSSQPRTRVLDGGNPVATGTLNLGYTQYRADRLVNVDGISYQDTVIGKRRSYGRGGSSIVDMIGKLVHEISAGVSFDDGNGWHPEALMVSNTNSRIRKELYPASNNWPGNNGLQNAYEYATRVPATAKKVSIYFHVKTYLVADYGGYYDITEKKYADGQKVLLREGWDNPSGSGSNFEFPVEAAPSSNPDVKRTVIFIRGETKPGQDMFVRGGLDHGIGGAYLGFACTTSNFTCAVPITYRNTKNATTNPWKKGDGFLDWYGLESGQATGAPSVPQGSASDWTTDVWPSAWGAPRTVAVDGYGVEALNKYGQHYWMLDADVDCSRAYLAADGSRYFDIKSYISNGPGWEADVNQAGTPYKSINHVAKCGKVNVFERGTSNATFADF